MSKIFYIMMVTLLMSCASWFEPACSNLKPGTVEMCRCLRRVGDFKAAHKCNLKLYETEKNHNDPYAPYGRYR